MVEDENVTAFGIRLMSAGN